MKPSTKTSTPRRSMLACALAAAVGAVASPAAAAPSAPASVTLRIVRVVASGTRSGQADPTVDPKLDAYRARLLRLHMDYGSYVAEGADEKHTSSDAAVEVVAAGGVRLRLVPHATAGAERIQVAADETPRDAKDPCIKTTLELAPKAPALVTCPGVPGPSTLLFLVTAELAGT